MTLRGRLTTAFLAVVLGPVLLGALVVGSVVHAAATERSGERLERGEVAVGASIGAMCRQLGAAAGAIAVVTEPAGRAAVAGQFVAKGLASGVRIAGRAGQPILTTPGAPKLPWTDCAAPAGGAGPHHAIAARVDLRNSAGTLIGSVRVAQVIDEKFIARLAAAGGAGVTVLDANTGGAALSSEPPADRGLVAAAARRTAAGDTAETADGHRYVRRIGPAPNQPLPLALSVPRDNPQGLYALLGAAVILAGLLAVAVAWWLARRTTRPLAELASAADRVARGDLAVRVPVRGHDEVGRLASAFNRMTRETQAYVQALTAGRDQLRGHLAILGDTLSSTHDLGRILQVILQTAVAATGARAGVVLLLDPATRALVGQCAEGLEDRWPIAREPVREPEPESTVQLAGERDPAALRVPLGSGVLGTVAATGVPLRGHAGRDGPALSPYEPRCRTYVALPFSMPGPADTVEAAPAALGVLALYDRLGADEFDDSDVTTLRTFAGQAAVAVDNVRVHEEAQRLSLTDPLTGLWNYRYLQESVRREVERASRFGRMLTVLALDLDRFKEVNDGYGRGAGDAVLVEFAQRIRNVVREVDLPFRQGGEEFVVLLPETDAAGGLVVAERLVAAVRDTPVVIEPTPGAADAAGAGAAGAGMTRGGPAGGRPGSRIVRVTVSIGVAVYPDHATTAQQLLDAADDALYAAKAAGRDTYRIAAVTRRPVVQEISVPAVATTPQDGMPRAGGPERPTDSTVVWTSGGAPGGTHPTPPSRGR
ncbi:MAG TPA: diguanylate cyclase [Pilimelia sp.]|nr:diguanylate cyclase [Pilimelia sp.]